MQKRAGNGAEVNRWRCIMCHRSSGLWIAGGSAGCRHCLSIYPAGMQPFSKTPVMNGFATEATLVWLRKFAGTRAPVRACKTTGLVWPQPARSMKRGADGRFLPKKEVDEMMKRPEP